VCMEDKNVALLCNSRRRMCLLVLGSMASTVPDSDPPQISSMRL
jgi:hypothetical protein